MSKLKIARNVSFHSIFWGWNLIFITTFYLGLLPYIGIPLITGTFDGDIAVDVFITFCAFLAVPVVCIYLGWKYFLRRPNQLMCFFYGVEAPLVTWCFVRLLIVRELTLASGFILGTLLISVFAYALNLFKPEINLKSQFKFNPYLEIIINSLILLTGIYLSTVILFHAIPIAINVCIWLGELIVSFFSFEWTQRFIDAIINDNYFIGTFLLLGLATTLIIFSGTLLGFMPLAVSFLYTKLGLKTWRDFADRYSKTTSTIVTVGVIGVWLAIVFTVNQQPQVKAFATLEKNPR